MMVPDGIVYSRGLSSSICPWTCWFVLACCWLIVFCSSSAPLTLALSGESCSAAFCAWSVVTVFGGCGLGA
jgi:hypothetical protein